ncbi:MAG: trigger factor [Proteobacteria bacterium]|nr:trigger factor [Pseudomonadota bacterium]
MFNAVGAHGRARGIGMLIGSLLQMHTSVEKSTTLERRLTVEIPEDRIATEVQTRLDKLSKNARIPGFRQGKAPAKVVRQQFGSRVRDEVVGEILQSSFGEAMNKEDLRPAGQPVIDKVESAVGNGLRYTAVFEVFPQFELAPLENLAVVRRTCEIGDADVDAMIERLREQNKEWLAVERASANGDQLSIDFLGTIDGVPFEGAKGENFTINLGSGMMIEGFEAGLTGKTAGEKVVLDLRFPDEYRNTELAGKPVRFEITVNKVSEALLPELTDEFMQKFGVKEGGVEAFRAEVRQNMEKERERALRQQFTSEVMDKLAIANDFELPSALVQSEAQRLRQQVAREMAMRGLNPSNAIAEFENSVQAQAHKRVKLGLVMAEIVKQAQLKADPAKVHQTIEGMAASYEDPAAVVKWYYENPQQLQQIEGMCLEDEAVNWIAGRAQLSEQAVSFDALMNPVQTDNTTEAST